jgi:hypothetical protein
MQRGAGTATLRVREPKPMTTIAIIAGCFTLVFGWSYFLHKRSGRPLWNPLWTGSGTSCGRR